jgi:hypothetical protein
MGVAAADLDNDGYTVNHRPLYHNNGNGTFTDVTKKAWVARLG